MQLLGGIILHQGNISEMKTGEGKTLVATLPAYLNSLTEKGVHVVTVNDYLAKRDSEWMSKIYNFLGVSVGCIINGIDDVREGLTAIISVKVKDPKFSSQTKEKLVSSEVRPVVEGIVNEKLEVWFDQNNKITKALVNKIYYLSCHGLCSRSKFEINF